MEPSSLQSETIQPRNLLWNINPFDARKLTGEAGKMGYTLGPRGLRNDSRKIFCYTVRMFTQSSLPARARLETQFAVIWSSGTHHVFLEKDPASFIPSPLKGPVSWLTPCSPSEKPGGWGVDTYSFKNWLVSAFHIFDPVQYSLLESPGERKQTRS